MGRTARGVRASWAMIGLVWCACDSNDSIEFAHTSEVGEVVGPLQDGHEAPQRRELAHDERLALGAFVVDGVVRCTAALIEVGRDARFAMTARHCFEREPDLSAFRFVSMDALARGDGVALAKVWPHPDVDAALVMLTEPIAGARPFAMMESDAAALIDTELEVAGAGLGSGGAMRFGVFDVVDVSATRIEVRSDTSGQCAGDSGGPWFSDQGEIVAVASTSAPSCGNPAFGVRLDRLVGWVAAHTELPDPWSPPEVTALPAPTIGTTGCSGGTAWPWAILLVGISACHRRVRSA